MIKEAAKILKESKASCAFTGAGISVESNIPPFRGEGGLWTKYDPRFLEISYYCANPEKAWPLVKEIFYDFFGSAKPNKAHCALAEMEKNNLLNSVITQNIDNLHQEAGSKVVLEYHGSSQYMICTHCEKRFHINELEISSSIPLCKNCKALLKPDFIFFGEPIPEDVHQKSIYEALNSDVVLVIGTTGEIVPASMIPGLAKNNGAKIIEINPEKSEFTRTITDIFINEKATDAMTLLMSELMD